MGLKTIKLLKENIGSNLLDISLSNIFLDLSPEARKTKAKINCRTYARIKNFCTVKKTINKMESQPRMGEDI